MKHRHLAILLALFFLVTPALAQDEAAPADNPDRPIRVACVGDGITYGTDLPERERWCYPALLQSMLGDGYDVRNFGVPRATFLAPGDVAYIEQQAYQDALAYEPDIVVVQFGANVTRAENWQHPDGRPGDYQAMIRSFQDLPSQPRVVFCYPPPAFENALGVSAERINTRVIAYMGEIAVAMGLEVVDLHTPLTERGGWFPDGVHPNSFGAEAIAKRVYESVSITEASLGVTPMRAIEGGEALDAHAIRFHGFSGVEFVFELYTARVVAPRIAAAGRPWVWRARFWGHEPQADIAMLERGWHIVYCDVSNLFGNDQAVERWDGFYELMRGIGLGEDLVLEGMSRGGLIIYNWAKQNPEKVSAIYGDAPVCDIRSWPGGLGGGRGSAADWERAQEAYGLLQSDPAFFEGNPIDGLSPLAEHGVPLLHIVGDADDVVPVSENSDVLEERYRALGGDITVIRKPGVGHHPHSLPDPTPIVDFFLEATGRKINFATVARPSVEFRAGAGWGGQTWWSQHELINAMGEANDYGLVFLGDSITQGFTPWNQRDAAQLGGRSLFRDRFGDFNPVNFGISGDRTEHLLYRIAHGNFDHIDPKVIVLMIGVNNINAVGNTGEETAEGTRAVVAALREKVPGAHVIVLGCFPTGPRADSPNRLASDALHANIADIGDDNGQVTYLDLRPLFLNDDGTLNGNMRGDAIHITSAGYTAWADAIEPLVRALVAQ